MRKLTTLHHSLRSGSGQAKSVYAVILVGGIGKRLRPLSKPSRPKPFLSVTGDNKTLLSKTVERMAGIIPKENIVVVANKSQAKLVKESFPSILKKNILLEKVSRNTAPAIAFAALSLKKRDTGAFLVVLPADHYIGNKKAYLKTIKEGIDFALRNPSALVTIGLEPYFPATGYGYIRIRGKRHETLNHNIYRVEKFVEKPDLKNAIKFIKDGNYLWNSGTFIFKATTFLGAIRRLAADIYGAFKDLRRINERYEKLPDISVDYAIMEKAYDIYCVKGSYPWEDIGNFESLKKVLKMEGRRFTEKAGKVTRIL